MVSGQFDKMCQVLPKAPAAFTSKGLSRSSSRFCLVDMFHVNRLNLFLCLFLFLFVICVWFTAFVFLPFVFLRLFSYLFFHSGLVSLNGYVFVYVFVSGCCLCLSCCCCCCCCCSCVCLFAVCVRGGSVT